MNITLPKGGVIFINICTPMSTKQRRTIRTLSHCYYDLKYHLVWTPKYRGKVLRDQNTKKEITRIFQSVARWKQWEILELSIQDDHIHMILLADPRYSVSYIMQIMKGKSSAWLKKKIKNRIYLYDKGSLWARGYFVSSVGIDEFIIKRYVRHQHHHNQLDQPTLFPLPR